MRRFSTSIRLHYSKKIVQQTLQTCYWMCGTKQGLLAPQGWPG
jgi:hypothetical protein